MEGLAKTVSDTFSSSTGAYWFAVLSQRKAFQVSDEIEMRIGCEDGAVVPKRNGRDYEVGQW